MADKTSFYEMLNTALENHPNEDIWVKTHPDVVCGKKEGFLYPSPIANPRIKLLSEKSSPWDLLLSARHVYTVSSLMGFEALLAGAKVYCFGMPFYAGWGVTQDRLTEPRRNRKRSISQIFYASYIQYARYVDPILSKRCQIEDTITHIIETLDRDNSQKMSVNISNLSRWKRTWIGDFLQYWQLTNEKSSTTNLVWGRQSSEVYDQLTVEDGFLRSVGLGVHFNRPISLVCDKTGIYFDSTRPSDLENILNHFTPTDWELFRSEQLIRRLNASSITKYNVGNETVPKFPANNRTILVPGQVEGDASLTFGSPIIKKNADLLQQVRINNPDAYIIYKPHPDVVAGIRDEGEWKGSYLKYADEVIVDTSMSVLLDCIDEVHTMTSLTGFEALLRGKKVTTYGVPFYSGWGLTTDKVICERRTAKRSLPELVAAALIYYPAYVDPVTRQPCSVEQALDRLIELKSGNVQVSDKKLAFLLGLKSVRRWLKAHIFRHNQ
jgi:capsular polysaccharide export protein